MFKVTKKIDFCYGHRLLRYVGKCRHLHGHNGVVEVDLVTDALDARGMVVDFADVKAQLKAWIDDQLDHKLILCADDPLVPVLRDRDEEFLTLPDNPTAENIAKLIFDRARSLGLPVVEVRLWETPTSRASYCAAGQWPA